ETFFQTSTVAPPSYALSLHAALPICRRAEAPRQQRGVAEIGRGPDRQVPALVSGRERARLGEDRERGHDPERRREPAGGDRGERSEEHTSELQSRENLVCRLLLEKNK